MVPTHPFGHGATTVHAFQDEAAVTLSAGPTALTVLPDAGMLGVSLTHLGAGFLDMHGGAAAARGGHTTGLPLLAPWANRLGGDRYSVAGHEVDLSAIAGLHRDGNGLPIHGTLVGRSGWVVTAVRTRPGFASLVARFDAGADPEVMASFPFPHVLTLHVVVRPHEVVVRTTLEATGESAVPVSFGWHPYFRLPARPHLGPGQEDRPVARDLLAVGLPARRRLVLDDRQIPTGDEVAEPAEVVPLAGRTFDDGYRLGGDRRFALVAEHVRLGVAFDRGYPFAQVYAPEGQDVVAIEPMTAPTDALGSGSAPLVEPGGSHSARFSISFHEEP